MLKDEMFYPDDQQQVNNVTLTTLIQHSTGSSSQCNKARKENKRHTDWKEKDKTVLSFK